MTDVPTKLERLGVMASALASDELRDKLSPAQMRECRGLADAIRSGLAEIDITLSADVILALSFGASTQAAVARTDPVAAALSALMPGNDGAHPGVMVAVAMLATDVLEGVNR